MIKVALVLAVTTVLGLAGYNFAELDSNAPQSSALATLEPQGQDARPPTAMSPVPGYRIGDEMIVQTSGTVCSTPEGECTVPQGPINSFCTCGGTPGRIVR